MILLIMTLSNKSFKEITKLSLNKQKQFIDYLYL
jgi:hypothetical protein